MAKAKTTKAAKTAKAAKPAKAVNSAFMKPLVISEELAAVVGKGPMPRTEITKKIWVYIKKHELQDEENKRMINPDEKLAKVFGSKKPVDMFKMVKLLSKHVS